MLEGVEHVLHRVAIVCAGVVLATGIVLSITRKITGRPVCPKSQLKGGPSIRRSTVILSLLAGLLGVYFGLPGGDFRGLVAEPLKLLVGVCLLWISGHFILSMSKKERASPLYYVDLAACIFGMALDIY